MHMHCLVMLTICLLSTQVAVSQGNLQQLNQKLISKSVKRSSPTSKDCTITLPDDIPLNQPVYFIKINDQSIPSLLKPTGKSTRIPTNAKLILACIGPGNNLALLSQRSIELTCRSDGSFFSDEKSQAYKLSELNCRNMPTSDISPTTNECGGSQQAYQLIAGYAWDTYFGSVFSTCYDKAKQHTLYSRNIINGAAIKYKIIDETRRTFRAKEMLFNTNQVNTIYLKRNQIKRFQAYFGESQEYVNDTSYFARGHLTPDADFVFNYEQVATYFYTNVAPEFQAINAGNWIKVENAARRLAANFNSDLLTFTGYLGNLKLPTDNKDMKTIYLDTGNYFPAPEWFYKVLIHPQLPTSLVMITLNNPFAEHDKIHKFCRDVCSEYGLNDDAFTDITSGYTFCCTLNEFQQGAAGIPHFDLPLGW